MRRLLGFLTYLLAGIPAIAGVLVVARHAYATSDTPIDGAGSAFLYGMIALAAYGGPAVVIAVWMNAWRLAACILSLIVAATMIANVSQTLGAIASRNAGIEAERAKAESQIAADRARIAQIDGELARLPVVAVTQEAFAAALAAARGAENTKVAECAHWRTPKCVQAERDEQSKRDTLARLAEAKGASEQRVRLTAEAAALRAKLERAPAVKERDPLGKALGELLSMPEAKASQIQLGIVAAIFELVVAAVLALPEMLRSRQPDPPMAARDRGNASKPEKQQEPATKPTAPTPSDTVGRFLLARLPKEAGGLVSWGDIYKGYSAYCKAQGLDPLPLPEFGKRLSELCKKAKIRTEKKDGKVYCLNVKLVA